MTSTSGADGAPSATETRAGAAAATARRNFRFGVLNGTVFQVGDTFLDSNTVVPLFLARLTTSNALIGFGSGLADMLWLLPQVVVAPRIARHPRQLWLYRRAATVRAIVLGLIAALTVPLAADHPGLLLGVFLVCYATYCLGGGVAALPFMEVVAKTVPPERLGSFWARRLFWGGLLAAGAGLLVRAILEIDDFGLRFALLFGIGAILVSLGYACFLAIDEPDGAPGLIPASPLALLREGVARMRGDEVFRRLYLSRATLSIWYAVAPFVVLFAVRDLGAGPRAAGTFLFARVTGYVLSNLVWSRIARAWGYRAVLRTSTALIASLSAAAAAIAWVSPYGAGWIGADAAVVLLEIVAGLGGAALSGMIVGYASLVLITAPPGRRQTHLAIMHSFLGPTLLLPALGGALVDATRPPVLFALGGAAALLGWRAASRLPAAAESAAGAR